MLNRKFLLGTTVIAGFAAASVAWAQDPAAAPEAVPVAAAPAPAEPAAESDDSEVEALIVTGSRIKQTEFTSTAPIQVITSEDAELQGVADTGQMLQSSTLAAGSPQINSTISTALVTNGGPGASTISLRGLGANRTLVLLNGRRAGPAGTRGTVSAFDLNVIPQSSIERIEILKDGASSIYGSDAVAGVVNIITKSNRDGGEIEAFASQPFESGGESYRLSGSWGKTFDRGFVSIAGDYYLQTEQTLGDRDYTTCAAQYTRSVATGARNDVIDPRTGKPACTDVLWGHVWLYDYTGLPGEGAFPAGSKLQYDYDGDLGQYIPRRPGAPYPQAGDPGALGMPDGFYYVGYDDASDAVQNGMHPAVLSSTLTPELERATLFVNGAYDIADGVEAYGEFLLNRRATKSNGFRQFWTYLNTSDHHLDFTTGDVVPGGGDPFSVGFTGAYLLSPTPITDLSDAEQEVTYGRLVGGLRGSVSAYGGWDWDVFTQLSRSDANYSQDVILKDALDSAAFRTGSCVGTTLPVSGKPCIDIDWLSPDFLAGSFTDEEREFLFQVEHGATIYTQALVEASLAGQLWTLPAGPIGAAVGIQYRRDELEDTPGAVSRVGNAWGSSASGITTGDDTTAEVFGELQIPVAKALPGIEDLSLSVSGRWTDVASYGASGTYKVGLNWQVTPGWRIRATKGTSFRAPALFEQFLADETSFPSQRAVDPCIRWAAALAAGTIPQRVADNCAADGIPGNHAGGGSTATLISSGSQDLEAETSDAMTIGVIWTPSFLDLNVALDYFEIEIRDEVTQLGTSTLMACYNSEFFPTDPICNRFTRLPGTHLVDEIQDPFMNIASQVNRGIDLSIRYAHEFDFGRFVFDSQFTWQLEDQTELFEGFGRDTNGDVGDPDFVGNLNFRFDREGWTVNWAVDMIGKASEAEDIADHNNANTTKYKLHTEFTAYHALSVRRKLDDWTMVAGIANLFDEAPPALTTLNLGQFGTIGTSVLGSQYDYFGRRAFFSVAKKF